jgi:hypothetical protein
MALIFVSGGLRRYSRRQSVEPTRFIERGLGRLKYVRVLLGRRHGRDYRLPLYGAVQPSRHRAFMVIPMRD